MAEVAIAVVWIRDDCLEQTVVSLPQGSRVADALARLLDAAMLERIRSLDNLPAADWAQGELTVAIFGQRARMDDLLHEHDRIELLPGLRVDPKIARQRRAEHRRRQKGERRWAPDRRTESV